MALAATIVALAGCGSTQSTSTRTSTIPPGASRLDGCYSLPFSAGSYANQGIPIYHITTTPTRVCFRRLGSTYTSQAAPPRSYGDPIIDTDMPRSGDYSTTYYRSEHRWFLVPVKCPCS
jgi:hypothetical protein